MWKISKFFVKIKKIHKKKKSFAMAPNLKMLGSITKNFKILAKARLYGFEEADIRP